ncbi:hypothetical protein Clacol_004110 [Clathrus columnatus]|uniref:Uncharacterized protein n=1 Tax=Clathrus columnatus TaxID=1419009 RepID=A0AAV5A5G8_9AGAM|nr:hypothetical protein Clacol_004110 [Clathrus columnatus]
MARTAALGSWLKQSQDVGTKRSTEQRNARRELLVWRIRGVLWVATLILFIYVNVASNLHYDLDGRWVAIVLPAWSLLSIFWAFWDPTWSTLGIFWITKLRIKKPPKVRLLGSKNQSDASSRATSPAVVPPPAEVSLSNLSLLTSQSALPTKHVFGQPSFPKREPEISSEDMMDWTPVNTPDKDKQAKEIWIRPQKFFPPEQPTGLEDLFQKAAKLDDDASSDHKPEDGRGWSRWKHKWKLQDYKIHIYMVLVGATITCVLGLFYISMQRLSITKTPQQTSHVRLDDL